MIRLENGLIACLVSDLSCAPVSLDDSDSESGSESGGDTESEVESEGGSNTADDEDDCMPKKSHNAEQKMVRIKL